MNIADFIKNNKELNNLPFLICYKTICVLNEMGMLKEAENVETEKRKPDKQ